MPLPVSPPHTLGAPRRVGNIGSVDADTIWSELVDRAAARYRAGGRFALHFARGKLSRDPVFRALIERGDLAAGARVLDLGCGQALLAALCHVCGEVAAQGRWPAGWGAAPLHLRYHGIELMPRDVARARAGLQGLSQAQVEQGDVRDAALPPCDVVLILDVLHYVDPAAQEQAIARVHAALSPHGRLLLRVGDASQRWRHAASQWVDRLVTGVRGHRAPPTWSRTLAQWQQLLAAHGFAAQPLPMSRGTPFANVLLACERLPLAAPVADRS